MFKATFQRVAAATRLVQAKRDTTSSNSTFFVKVPHISFHKANTRVAFSSINRKHFKTLPVNEFFLITLIQKPTVSIVDSTHCAT